MVTEDVKSSLADYPTYTISVTGHSMGASLAVFAAQTLHALFPDDNDRLTTYTYGQPRTGNPSWAAYIDSLLSQSGKLFRVTHANDGVPQVPSTSDGYQHHEEEYWANDPPSVENTVRCEGDEPPVQLARCYSPEVHLYTCLPIYYDILTTLFTGLQPF